MKSTEYYESFTWYKRCTSFTFIGSTQNLPYVKTTTLTEEKAQLLEDLKESVDTLNQVKKGEIKLKSARDLFNEFV
jgi:hypothetical protein